MNLILTLKKYIQPRKKKDANRSKCSLAIPKVNEKIILISKSINFKIINSTYFCEGSTPVLPKLSIILRISILWKYFHISFVFDILLRSTGQHHCAQFSFVGDLPVNSVL